LNPEKARRIESNDRACCELATERKDTHQTFVRGASGMSYSLLIPSATREEPGWGLSHPVSDRAKKNSYTRLGLG
jgi:hypothetical protein